MKTWLKKNWKTLLSFLVFSALIGVPVHLYINYFGSVISTDHQRWAEMGSAMSGIYGPILALLTFFVLMIQLRLQKNATQLQVMTTEHMLAQAFAQDARADIKFYLDELEHLLDREIVIQESPRSITTPRKMLIDNFIEVVPGQLREVEPLRGTTVNLHDMALWLNLKCPQLQATWSGIYTIYHGLEGHPIRQLDTLLVTSKQKTIAKIDMPLCIAMDHFLYCFTRNGMGFHYQYSSVIHQA